MVKSVLMEVIELYVIKMIVLLSSYASIGRFSCFRSVQRNSNGIRVARTSVVHIGPRSGVCVLISNGSSHLAVPFGVRAADSSSSAEDIKCIISSRKGVSFPNLNLVTIGNLAQGRVTLGVGGALVRERLMGRPVMCIRFVGFTFAMLNSINDPNHCGVRGSRVAVVRTVNVTNSLAIANGEGGVLMLHRRGKIRGDCAISVASTSRVVSSPICCLRRGSIVCIRPGGIGTGRSAVGNGAMKGISF